MNRIIYIDNLQDKQKQRYTSKKIEVLTPKEIFNEKLEDTDALVVLCELNSDKDENKINRSDFYGVKLVQELRKNYGFKGNVLFVSFMKKSFFLQNKVKYGLISFNRGHSFLRLPVNIDTIKKKTSKIVKLDYLSFRDVQLFGSDIKGTVSERLHALDSIENDYEKYHKELLTQLCNYFNIPADEIIIRYEQINDTKHEKLSFVKKECEILLNKYLNEGVKGYEIPKYKWSVLWLDDEIKSKEYIGETIPIIKHLREYRNIEVIVAGTYEEAMSLWEEDKAKENRIMQIVVDYRLQIKNEDGIEYNTNQGYHFIQEIIERDSNISIIVYSGMPRKFLMESFVQYGKKIQFFSKIDFPIYKNSTFIGDEIVVNGDNAWLESNNQPVSASWKSNDGNNKNGLKMNEVYFQFKNSVEFNAWNRICNIETRKNLIIYNKNKCTNFNISGSIFTSSPKKQLPKLKDILIARRFAITELAKAYINGNDIIKRKKEIGDYIFRCSNKNKKPNDKSADAVFNRLALTPAFFPMFLLPEEYSWLKYESGLNFDTSKKIDNYFSHLNKIKKIFSEIFKKHPGGYLVSLLDESFIKVNTKNITSNFLKKEFSKLENEKWFYFDKDYQPYIRTITDVKLIIEFIYNKLKEECKSNNGNFKQNLTEFVMILRKLRKFTKQTNIKSFKTIEYFVNSLNPISEKLPSEITRIDEEYSYLLAPWEFRFQYNLRINPDYLLNIKRLKNNCIKALEGNLIKELLKKVEEKEEKEKKEKKENKKIEDENLETLKLAKKGIELDLLKKISEKCKEKRTLDECNDTIYNAILLSNIERKKAFDEYLLSKNINTEQSNVIKEMKINDKDGKIKKAIKNYLNISEDQFNNLDIKYFSVDDAKKILEIEIDTANFISIIAFNYVNSKYFYFIDREFNLLTYNDIQDIVLDL